MTPTGRLKPHQASILIAAGVSLLLWAIPVFGFVLLPLQYLNTHLHEFSHAFVGIVTGAEVGPIRVFANGSGVTLVAGGSPVLVSSAGYIGATIIGALVILFGRTERGAEITLRSVAVVLVLSFAFWVRGDLIGVVSGIFWIGALLWLPSVLKGKNLVLLAQFIGMQQCLASIQALYILLKISVYPDVASDAGNMAKITGVPAMVWAVLWGMIGLGTLYVTLRAAWGQRPAAS